MTDHSSVWHFGLVAELWASFIPETPELEFLKEKIAQYGEPVLDVGCGVGRLLIALLQKGVDIDGVDISTDMLSACQEKLRRENLSTRLYEQPMSALQLPRPYKTIYICDSFGLAGSRQLDELTLESVYRQLLPGGVLILNKEAPYNLDDWSYWKKEERNKLPEPWPEESRRSLAEGGVEYERWIRLLSIDPLEQTCSLQIRVQKRMEGRVLAEEERTLVSNFYFRNELVAILEKAGFREIAVYAGYSQQSATADDEDLVYIAVK